VDNGRAVIEAVLKARPSAAKGAYVARAVLAATQSPGVTVDHNA
jgi:large subunit ribosomal protein L1